MVYEFALQLKCASGSVSQLGNIFSHSTTGCSLNETASKPSLVVYPNPTKLYIAILKAPEIKVFRTNSPLNIEGVGFFSRKRLG